MKIPFKYFALIAAVIAALSFTLGTRMVPAHAGPQQTTPGAPDSENGDDNESEEETAKFEGTMTLERINEIISKIDENATSPQAGSWQFTLASIPLMIVTDATNDRMRVMAPITKAETLTKADLLRISQANFDSALDARYAVAQEILWAVYIHPLRALHDRQFISALAQTATTAATYGKSYSSGAFVFGGGDSQGIIQQELIDTLKGKGLEV